MRARRNPLVLLGIAAFAIGGAHVIPAQERVTGRATIIDGDSFEIGDVGVRLFGVDAPEGRQPCVREGREWQCGEAAAAELRRLVGSRDVVCRKRDEDTYGRIVAVCHSGTVDLGAAMVRAGLAVAYRRYSDDYVDEERQAQAARRGVWAGTFASPEDWRRDERVQETAAQPTRTVRAAPEPSSATRSSQGRRSGCDIKGNINSSGERIYHTTASPSYAETGIDEDRGERWFCTEAEARAAGWRAPRG
jgi:endonuclease YncB( thermonuclease family)